MFRDIVVIGGVVYFCAFVRFVPHILNSVVFNLGISLLLCIYEVKIELY